MKEILQKYYDLNLDFYKEYNDGIIFFVNGDYYYLCKTLLNNSEIQKSYKIYLSLKNKNIILHDFIINNNGELLSEDYVLLKLNYMICDIDVNDIYRFNIRIDSEEIDDFYSLWVDKIDYLEIQLIELSKNKLINYSFDYFVGIAELLLIFFKDNYIFENDTYLVHRSFMNLNTIDFYNPLNIIVGHKCKDITTYIRLSNNWDLLYRMLDSVNINDKVYIFVRLCFPYIYFNLVNKMLIDGSGEEDLLDIVNKITDYENYLRKMDFIFGYNLFSWIKKDD